jgi:hypothetical protein
MWGRVELGSKGLGFGLNLSHPVQPEEQNGVNTMWESTAIQKKKKEKRSIDFNIQEDVSGEMGK